MNKNKKGERRNGKFRKRKRTRRNIQNSKLSIFINLNW
jgi:hypothetical protein